MYHSVIFGTNVSDMVKTYFGIPPESGETRTNVYNTWDSWHLIPSSRPVVQPPPVKTKSVEIPGADGQLDLTEILAGAPLYGNRSGGFDFYVQPDWYNSDTGRWETWDWTTAYQTIMGVMHGQRMYMILEDDSDYYYSGRFSVNSWKSNKDYAQITINFDLDPFKWSIMSTVDDWLWDPFDFETGYINQLSEMIASIQGENVQWPSFEVIGGTRRGMLNIKYTPDEGSNFPLYLHRVGDDPEKTATVNNTNGGFVTALGLFIYSGSNTIEYNGDGKFIVDYRRSEF